MYYLLIFLVINDSSQHLRFYNHSGLMWPEHIIKQLVDEYIYLATLCVREQKENTELLQPQLDKCDLSTGQHPLLPS